MPTSVQRRRGTTAQHSSFTGAAGELTIDTDKKTAVVHDGSTAGGFPLLKEAAVGSTVQAYDADLAADDALTTTGLINRTGAGTATTVTLPSGDLVGTSATQTLTNKTLTSPVISTVSNTGTLTLPTTTDTLVGRATTDTLTNKTLTSPELTSAPYVNGSYRGNIVAVAALDIDCSAGNYFTKTINANSTFTVSNAPSSRSYSFTLELTHTSGAITWFSGVEWPKATAPTLTTGKTHLFMFVTDDGGTRWRAAALVDYTT